MDIFKEKLKPLGLYPIEIKRTFHAPVCSGVYFFCNSEEVLYIGSSYNLRMRMGSHEIKRSIKKAEKNFFMYFIATRNIEYVNLEKLLINTIKPKLNKILYGGFNG